SQAAVVGGNRRSKEPELLHLLHRIAGVAIRMVECLDDGLDILFQPAVDGAKELVLIARVDPPRRQHDHCQPRVNARYTVAGRWLDRQGRIARANPSDRDPRAASEQTNDRGWLLAARSNGADHTPR